jgi:hypothetical protein
MMMVLDRQQVLTEVFDGKFEGSKQVFQALLGLFKSGLGLVSIVRDVKSLSLEGIAGSC